MERDFGHLRKNYEANVLDETILPNSPTDLFNQWFDEATQSGGVAEVNAMTLSTIDGSGAIKGRIVLLKELSAEGFVFYTNYNSDKSKALFANPKVSLSFFWPNLERQVIISGTAQKVAPEVSDAYFASRPKGSQIGAHVSPQSDVIASREVLEARQETLEKQFEGKDIPRPSHWGGIAVTPFEMEFWQGRPNRLHDRIVYLKSDDSWSKQRKAP
ncbi:MAG: pyridoxamine 5'-phosphate oxidase [Flavobacteriaceae bacterium]|nr:pyridoxamine 5'-phosphate oxidase [Flavobacteriaceae bacterium]MDG2290420.1 pyridoxamine 5'-phosphate oxidase [Flavobacteriaceae bacterium]